MITLGPLAFRLARAGGRLRTIMIVMANLVAAALILCAFAVPDAVVPVGPDVDPGQRRMLQAVIAFILAPVAVLLLTVGRIASGTRDRRLAGLRLLGVTPAKTNLVAALENCALALPGAVAGAAMAMALAPVVGRVGEQRGWFVAPLAPTTSQLGLATLIVLSISAGTAIASARALRAEPREVRHQARQQTPTPWRLLVLGSGLLALIALATDITLPIGPTELLMAGVVLTGVGIVVTTPLLSHWLARRLARSPSPTMLLAGRAVEAEPISSGRLVAAFGLAVYLVVAAMAILSTLESAPQLRAAALAVGPGPQEIFVSGPLHPAPDPARIAALTAEMTAHPGVRAVMPRYNLQDLDCPDGDCPSIVVSTCSALSEAMVATGCQESAAARIVTDGANADSPDTPPPAGATLTLDTDPPSSSGPLTISLDGPVIHQDGPATRHTHAFEQPWSVFIPEPLVSDRLPPPESLLIIADGGRDIAERVAAMAAAQDLTAHDVSAADYPTLVQARTLTWTLTGIVLLILTLTLASATIDRVLERRRAVARQLALGVPGRVLRGSQFAQTLLPLVTVLVLGGGSAELLRRAYTTYASMPAGDIDPTRPLVALLVCTAASLLLVTTATIPLIRTRLTPDLLRSE